MKKTVVLGVTSGIAAYKSVDLAKLLQDKGYDVEVVMTQAATQMVNHEEFENVTGKKVYTDHFEKEFDYKEILQARKVDHIALADKAEVIVIAPATANTLAKLAHGLANDFLTTMVLAANSPVVVCPSMNVHMWKNPVTQENIRLLKKRGMTVLDPESGMLACGYEGPGRLPHLQIIVDEVIKEVNRSNVLKGKKIIVTAGGTSEPIDLARVITNRSSGKMGCAIADEAYLQGADVLLFRSTTSVSPRYHIKEELFETVDDLEELIKKYAKHYDTVFHTAAVSDFKPVQFPGKLSSKEDLTLSFEVGKKIINEIKKYNPKIAVIGFKALASSDEKILIAKGQEKRKEAQADAIIVNDISRDDRGFQSDDNEVFVVTEKRVTKISLRSKQKVAAEILTTLFS